MRARRKLANIAGWLIASFLLGYLSPPMRFAPETEAIITSPTFTKTNVDTAYTGANVVGVGDLDGDGDKDIVTGPDGSGASIAWFENNGASPPSFTKHNICGTITYLFDVEVADMDGDNDLDIVLVGEYVGGEPPLDIQEIILCHNGGGTPPTFSEVTIVGCYSCNRINDSSLGDLNSDGRIDIATSSAVYGEPVWHRNDGGNPPTFTEVSLSLIGNQLDPIQVIDLDGDGKLDIAGLATANVIWFINGGGENFTVYYITPAELTAVNSIHFSDIDFDGDIDFFVEHWSNPDYHLKWARNNGSQNFSVENILSLGAQGDPPTNYANSVFGVDIDGDCDRDLIYTRNTTSSPAWIENRGTSWGAPNVLPGAFTMGTNAIGVAFNAGSETDILAVSATDGDIALWLEDVSDPTFGFCAYVNACARVGQGEAQGTEGIVGISVSLSGTSNGGSSISKSATTNSSGDVQFITPPSNSQGYSVSVGSVPAQYEVVGGSTKSGLVVALQQTVSAACFTLTARGAYIHAYEDSNASGAYEVGGDGNLVGASVEVYQGETLLERGVTNNEGIYHFRSISTGVTYEVFVSRQGFESNGERKPPFTFTPAGGSLIETVRTGFIRIGGGGGGGGRGRKEEGETSVTSDADGDGLLYWEEDRNLNGVREEGETDPRNHDTDSDGLLDGEEITLGTDPLKADTDGDSVLDGREVRFLKTDPSDPLKGAVRRLRRKVTEGTKGTEEAGMVRIAEEPVVAIEGMEDMSEQDQATVRLSAHLEISQGEFMGRNPLEVVFWGIEGTKGTEGAKGTEETGVPQVRIDVREVGKVASAHEVYPEIGLSSLLGESDERQAVSGQSEPEPDSAELEEQNEPEPASSASSVSSDSSASAPEAQEAPLPEVTLPLLLRRGEMMALLMLLSGRKILTGEGVGERFAEGPPFEDLSDLTDVKTRTALTLFDLGMFEGVAPVAVPSTLQGAKRYADLSSVANREEFLEMLWEVFELEEEANEANKAKKLKALEEAPEGVRGVMETLGMDFLPSSLRNVFQGQAGLTTVEAIRSLLLVSMATGNLEIPKGEEGEREKRRILAKFVGVELKDPTSLEGGELRGAGETEGAEELFFGLKMVVKNWEEEFEKLFTGALQAMGMLGPSEETEETGETEGAEGDSLDSLDSLGSSMEMEGVQMMMEREQERMQERMEKMYRVGDGMSDLPVEAPGAEEGMHVPSHEDQPWMETYPTHPYDSYEWGPDGMSEMDSLNSLNPLDSFDSFDPLDSQSPSSGMGNYQHWYEMQGDYGP
jgi:hypothetical protein